MATPNNQFLVDTLLEMKAAGLVASSAASSTILDLGAGQVVHGHVVIDVTALEIASNDEIYDIVVQLSPDATFGTAGNIQDAMSLSLSASEVKRTDSDKDDTTGTYVLPFRNEVNETVYRYARVYTVVGGTVASGINYTARLSVQ